MIYSAIDVQFWRHPRALKAGRAARDLWCWAHAYATELLTDGLIPAEALKTYPEDDGPELATVLVAVGLWEPTPDGWRICRFAEKDGQIKAEVDAKREGWRVEGQKKRDQLRREIEELRARLGESSTALGTDSLASSETKIKCPDRTLPSVRSGSGSGERSPEKRRRAPKPSDDQLSLRMATGFVRPLPDGQVTSPPAALWDVLERAGMPAGRTGTDPPS